MGLLRLMTGSWSWVKMKLLSASDLMLILTPLLLFTMKTLTGQNTIIPMQLRFVTIIIIIYFPVSNCLGANVYGNSHYCSVSKWIPVPWYKKWKKSLIQSWIFTGMKTKFLHTITVFERECVFGIKSVPSLFTRIGMNHAAR